MKENNMISHINKTDAFRLPSIADLPSKLPNNELKKVKLRKHILEAFKQASRSSGCSLIAMGSLFDHKSAAQMSKLFKMLIQPLK